MTVVVLDDDPTVERVAVDDDDAVVVVLVVVVVMAAMSEDKAPNSEEGPREGRINGPPSYDGSKWSRMMTILSPQKVSMEGRDATSRFGNY